MEEDRQRSNEAGMIAFLSKPLRMDELGEAIRQYARMDQNAIVAADDVAQASIEVIATAAEKLIDWARLEQFKEFDDEQMSMTQELIALFTADAPKRLQNIRQALAGVSMKDMSRAAHELRGAASNVGAVALAKSCQTLEELPHDSEWLGQADPLVGRVEDLMRQTLLELADFSAVP
jgi:HPt (histidine-containing phosphotransfer) domain-containing protein